MPLNHAISLNYDHTADIFCIRKSSKTNGDTSASLFRYLARESSVFNQLLLDIRGEFIANLHSYKGDKTTTLFNTSIRQSTQLELYENSRRRNGHSSSTLHHLAATLEESKVDTVKASNLSLADYIDEEGVERAPHLRAGFALEFDTMDDFDTYHYQTICDHSREKILKYQLADFANEHQGEPCEFIIIMDDKRNLAEFLQSEAQQLPSNLTIKLIEFNWHRLLIDKIGKEAVDKLKLINQALYFVSKLESIPAYQRNSSKLKPCLKSLIDLFTTDGQSDFLIKLQGHHDKLFLDDDKLQMLQTTLVDLSQEIIGDKSKDIAQTVASRFTSITTVNGKMPAMETRLTT